jgi:response regulator RpfG family c-di-GMP phosphodiesterase
LNAVSIVVLLSAAAATIGLVFYVQWFLPRQLEQRFIESMRAFSKAIELRFPNSTGRTDEIMGVAKSIGKRFGYTRAELHGLELSVYLRDIGCCSIPYHPFNDKPRSAWTEYESRIFERHPEVSGAMLELVPSVRHIAGTVRWHHARFDGRNVPGAPIGLDLPLNARILKIASDYVWLCNELGTGSAARVIQAGAGAEYCPEVVVEFVQMLTSTRVIEPNPSLA